MAAVDSEKLLRLQGNNRNVSSVKQKDSSEESSADTASCDTEFGGENSSVGLAGKPGSPAHEAQEHAQMSAAVPPIRIKEEPAEEGEYLTVNVVDVEENWEEQDAGGEQFLEGADGDWSSCNEEQMEASVNKQVNFELRREHTHDGPIVCLDTDSEWDNLLVSTDGGHQTLCCALCGCKFSNSREFFTHQLNHRNDIIKQETVLEDGEGLSKQKVFECKHCGKTYSSIGQCLNHERSHKQASKSVFHQLAHLKKKSFQCPTCGRSYSRASALDAHRRCHEEKLVKPRNSDGEKHSSEQVTLKPEDTDDTKAEQFEESPKKPFECLYCRRSFRTMGGLGTHQRQSVNCSRTTVKMRTKRSFDCTECGKTFDRHLAMASHLRWHRRKEQPHGNEKRFHCKECGKVFTSLTFCSRHQRLVHSQEMPAKSFLHQVFQLQKKAFECQECGRRFSRASALHSHQLCHTDAFSDIMEGSSQKSSAGHTALSYENTKDKAAHDDMQTNVLIKELKHEETCSTEDHKANADFKSVIIAASDSCRDDHGSQHNPDLELVCESDQEEKDLNSNPGKETVSPSRPEDPVNDANILQINCVNFNEKSENTEQKQRPSQVTETYECSECNRSFDKAISLRCHMLWHRGAMGKKLCYKRTLHVASPSKKEPLKCEICGHESFSKASHYAHLGKHEDRKPYKSIMYQLANLQKNSFQCDVCGMQFSRLSALQSHQQHHKLQKKPYECLKCDKSYSNLRTLYHHRKVCAGKKTPPTNSHCDENKKTEQFNPSKTLLGPKVHHCKKCGKGFWSMGAFFHHTQYNQQCSDVKASSSQVSSKSENGHVRRKRQHRKKCMITDNLKPHVMPDRIQSRLYRCDICDKSYRVIGCFIKHKLFHQNQGILPVKSFEYQVQQVKKNMYSCLVCHKSFSRAKALQFHMRSHGHETGLSVEQIKLSNTPAGPQCPVCNNLFTDEESLKNHKKHCLKARGEWVREGQEEKLDSLDAAKENNTQKQSCEDMMNMFEKALEAPVSASDLKYACDECDRSFSIIDALNVHKKTHCKVPISMLSESEYVSVPTSQLEEPTGQASFHCSECGRKFSTNSALGTHRRWHNDKKLARFILKSGRISRRSMDNGPFLCNLCGKGFFYLCVLRRHQKYHPPIVAQTEQGASFKISTTTTSTTSKSNLDYPYCDTPFITGSLTAPHLSSHHAKPLDTETKQQICEPLPGVHVSNQPPIPVVEAPQAIPIVGDRPKIKFHCIQCNKIFLNARGLRAHKWQKHRKTRGRPAASMNGGIKSFPCLVCEKQYGSQAALQNHQRSCSANNVRLKPPYKPEAVEEKLLHHRPFESGAKCLFKCQKCGKAFPSEKQLDAHKETAKTRPHSCALCCRGYWTESQLQQHLIWHDEVRRRLPTELRYRFNSSAMTTSSVKLPFSSTNLVSPEELPIPAAEMEIAPNYSCPQCSKRFLSSHALKEHQAVHKSEEPYCCSLCPETFAEIQDLIDHHQKCLGDKELGATPVPTSDPDEESLTCIECGVSFSQEIDLHQHYIDHARGEF